MTSTVAPATLPIPTSHVDLLTRPVCGVLTTMGADGQPRSSLVWVDHDGLYATVNTTLERRKGRDLRVNPKVSLGEAYHYAQLALDASERYPTVDPLLLLSIGTVESRYDPQARSTADARGLYQIWPSTGRLLLRSLGWNYDDNALYDPEKNTQAAALYLDILFSTYSDPQLVLAEYNGGPLNAGYFRAGVGALAAETRSYVPRVLQLHARLKDDFDRGVALQGDTMHRDGQREGKTLAGPPPAAAPAAAAARREK